MTNNNKVIVKFPEPEWRYLKDHELLYFKKFVSNEPWELLVKYWGIKERHCSWGYGYHRFIELDYERQPMYPYYNRRELKEYIKMVIKH